MKDPKALFGACDSAYRNPTWQPTTDKDTGIMTTHCNQAAAFVAKVMGCNDLDDHSGAAIRADSIYEMMTKSLDWRKVVLSDGRPAPVGAATLATAGSLVFGIMTSRMLGQEHGHICTVMPGDPLFSGNWDMLAPLCMNVGSQNFIGRPMSFAFRTCPEFWIWTPSA